jgi:U3 small nucleolar RNA-associated protein 10
MIKNTDVARFISSLLPLSLKHKHVHRTLVAFNAACLDDFMSKSKSLDEGAVAYLLPAILQPLQTVDHEFAQDSIVCPTRVCCVARFSQKVCISSAAIKVIINAMTDAAEHVSARQFLAAAIAVLSPQEEQQRFSKKTSKRILEIP